MVERPRRLPRHGPGLGGAGRRLDLAALPGAGGVRRDRPPLPLLRLRQRRRVHRRVPEARDQGLRHRLRGPGLGVPGRAERGRGSQSSRSTSRAASASATGSACGSSRRTATRSSGRRSSTTFPDGLVNSDGEPVDRPARGVRARATSTACPATRTGSSARTASTTATTMDRNNPVWREYLKAIIRIQIDAGVDGVQLDEAELPLTTLQYGGCFCKDCMKGFRAYLQALPADELARGARRRRPRRPSTTASGCSSAGYDFKADREATPLFGDYLRFQRGAITRYFAELADYAREYATSQGTRGARLRQLLQPARPVLRARAEGRPDHHRDAQHALPPAGVVPLRGRVRRPASRSSSWRTRTAASSPSWWRS